MTGFCGGCWGPKGVKSPFTTVFTLFKVVQELKGGREGRERGRKEGLVRKQWYKGKRGRKTVGGVL